MRISVHELDQLTVRALRNQGYGDGEIQVIKKVLLYAQLRGNDQGIVKLIGKGMPRNQQAGEIKTVHETPLSVRLDGGQNHAMLVLHQAADRVIEKAGKSGFGLAGTFNTSTSSGAIGYFASEIARAGFVGFVFSRAPERVAVHGSYEPVFGTNPLAVSLPVGPDPVVLDMSTAAMSFYGLLEARTAGRKIPETAAFDAEGQPTSDPARAIAGALRSFDGGHKGSGLALMVEALAGVLAGAGYGGSEDSKKNWGHLLFAIDPGLLGDKEATIRKLGELHSRVKRTKKLPGVEAIHLPGERGNQAMNACLKSGEVEIEDNLLEALRKAAA